MDDEYVDDDDDDDDTDDGDDDVWRRRRSYPILVRVGHLYVIKTWGYGWSYRIIWGYMGDI